MHPWSGHPKSFIPRKPSSGPRPVDDDDFDSTEDDASEEAVPRIESYKPGELRADGIAYHHDVVVLPRGIRGGWKRIEPGIIAPEDLRSILTERPEIAIFGTGPGEGNGCVVHEDAIAMLEQMMAEVIVLPTAQAVERYNELSPRRRTCAAILV